MNKQQPERNGSQAAPPRPYVGTPHAERYVIAADNLRRRQLKSALLHGSSRTWREQRRIWPSVAAGVIVVAIIVAAIAVAGAFQRQQELDQQGQASGDPPLSVQATPTSPRFRPRIVT